MSLIEKEVQMLNLAFTACVNFFSINPYSNYLQTAAVMKLLKLTRGEEIVWGPAMHSPGLFRPTDALALITKNQDTKEYTLIYRGTNPISFVSWKDQDFGVDEMVDWNKIVPKTNAKPGARISKGANLSITRVSCASIGNSFKFESFHKHSF